MVFAGLHVAQGSCVTHAAWERHSHAMVLGIFGNRKQPARRQGFSRDPQA